MEVTALELFLSTLFLLLAYVLLIHPSKRQQRYNLPPSPPSLPILGHLHLLKRSINPLHHTLHHLSKTYGPIMFLQFGTRSVVVVSSASLAQECFTKNDVVLANRPSFMAGKYFGYDYTTMHQSPYGDHWRNLRRVGSIEIFSNHRLNSFLDTRKDEVHKMLIKLADHIGSSLDYKRVELRQVFQEMMFNVIMRMVSGKRYYGEDVSNEREAREFRKTVKEAAVFGGTSNPGDFLPIMKWVYGIEKKMMGLGKKVDRFFQSLIDEYRRKLSEGLKNENSVIHHLLSLQKSEPECFPDVIIKGFILIMVLAGIETSAVTLEWAMSNLLNHPNKLGKLQDELDKKCGLGHPVDEMDLSKLSYLQNVISETFRLNPAAPLLLPHYSSLDCKVGGFDVPRDTIVLVNAWAIHRDPSLWINPECFEPERFEKEEAEAHNLMPFGLGRRACPGSGLAQRVVGLSLASLVQCFDWKRVSESEVINMDEEKLGTTIPKANPLMAMGKLRSNTRKILECIGD